MNKLQRIFGIACVSDVFLIGDIHNHCGISYGHGVLMMQFILHHYSLILLV